MIVQFILSRTVKAWNTFKIQSPEATIKGKQMIQKIWGDINELWYRVRGTDKLNNLVRRRLRDTDELNQPQAGSKREPLPKTNRKNQHKTYNHDS